MAESVVWTQVLLPLPLPPWKRPKIPLLHVLRGYSPEQKCPSSRQHCRQRLTSVSVTCALSPGLPDVERLTRKLQSGRISLQVGAGGCGRGPWEWGVRPFWAPTGLLPPVRGQHLAGGALAATLCVASCDGRHLVLVYTSVLCAAGGLTAPTRRPTGSTQPGAPRSCTSCTAPPPACRSSRTA